MLVVAVDLLHDTIQGTRIIFLNLLFDVDNVTQTLNAYL